MTGGTSRVRGGGLNASPRAQSSDNFGAGLSPASTIRKEFEMRDSRIKRNPQRIVAIVAALCILVALPLLATARARTNSINVVNSSSRQIIHVYLSPVDADRWGTDQLNGSVIAPGQSFEVSGVTCTQPQIKMVAEDADGCFLSAPVNCGGAVTWTITNDMEADCGH